MSDPDIGLDDLEAFYGLDLSDEDDGYHSDDENISSHYSARVPSNSPLNLDSLNFDMNQYIANLLTLPMNQILQRVTDLGEEKQQLDSEMQALVYDNYNKFITATDIIRSMNSSFESIEREMALVHQHLQAITRQSAIMVATLAGPKQQVGHFASLSQLLQSLRYLFKLPTLMKQYYQSKHYGLALRSYDAVAPFLHRYKYLPSFSDILDRTLESIKTVQSDLSHKMGKLTLFEPIPTADKIILNGHAISFQHVAIINNIMHAQYVHQNHTLNQFNPPHGTTGSGSGSGLGPNGSSRRLHLGRDRLSGISAGTGTSANGSGPGGGDGSGSRAGSGQAPSSIQNILLFTIFDKDEIITALDTLLLYILAGNHGGAHFQQFTSKLSALLMTYLLPSFCAVQHPQQPHYNFTLPTLLLDLNALLAGNPMAPSSAGDRSSGNTSAVVGTSSAVATGAAASAAAAAAGASTSASPAQFDSQRVEAPFLLIDDVWVPTNRLQFDVDSKIAAELICETNRLDCRSVHALPRSAISPIDTTAVPGGPLSKGTKTSGSGSGSGSGGQSQALSPSPAQQDKSGGGGKGGSNGGSTNNKKTQSQSEAAEADLLALPNNATALEDDLAKDRAIDAKLHGALTNHLLEKHAGYTELFAVHHMHVFLSLFFFIHYTKQRLLLPLLHTMAMRVNSETNASKPMSSSISSLGALASVGGKHITSGDSLDSSNLLLASQQHLYSNVVAILEQMNALSSTVLATYVSRVEFFTTQLFSSKPLLEHRQRVGLTTAASTPDHHAGTGSTTGGALTTTASVPSATPTAAAPAAVAAGPGSVTSGTMQTCPQSTLTQVQLSPCPLQLSILSLHSQLYLNEYMTNISDFIVSPIQPTTPIQPDDATADPLTKSRSTGGSKPAAAEESGNPFGDEPDDGGRNDGDDELGSLSTPKLIVPSPAGPITAASSSTQQPSLDIRSLFEHNQLVSDNIFPTLPQLLSRPLEPTNAKSNSAKANATAAAATASGAAHSAAVSTLTSLSTIGQVLPVLPYSAISLITREGQAIAPSSVVELYSLVNQFSVSTISDIVAATVAATGLLSSSLDDVVDTLDSLLVHIDSIDIDGHSAANLAGLGGGHNSGAGFEQLPNHMTSKKIDLRSRPPSTAGSTQSAGPGLGKRHSVESHHSGVGAAALQIQPQATSLAPVLLAFQRNASAMSVNSTMFLYDLAIKHFLSFLTLGTNILGALSLPSPFFNNPLLQQHQGPSVTSLDVDTKTQFKQSNELFSVLLIQQRPKQEAVDHANAAAGLVGGSLDDDMLVSNNMQLYNLDRFAEKDLSDGRIKTSMTLLESTTAAANAPVKTVNLVNFTADDPKVLSTPRALAGGKAKSAAGRNASGAAQSPSDNAVMATDDHIPKIGLESYYLVKSWAFALFHLREEHFSLTSHVVSSPHRRFTRGDGDTGGGGGDDDHHDDDGDGDNGSDRTGTKGSSALDEAAAQFDEELSAAIDTVKQYCSPSNVSVQLARLFSAFYAMVLPFIDLHTLQFKTSFLLHQQQQLSHQQQQQQQGQLPAQLYGNLSSLKQLLPHVSSILSTQQLQAQQLQQQSGAARRAGLGAAKGSILGTAAMPKFSTIGALSTTAASMSLPPALPTSISTGTSRLGKLAALLGTLGKELDPSLLALATAGSTSTGSLTATGSSVGTASANTAHGALFAIAPGRFALSTLPMTFQQHQLGGTSVSGAGSGAGSLSVRERENSTSGSNPYYAGSVRGMSVHDSWATGSVRYAASTGGATALFGHNAINHQQLANNIDLIHNEHQLQLKSIFILLFFRSIFQLFSQSYEPILCFPEKHTHIHLKDYRQVFESAQMELIFNVLNHTYGFQTLSVPNPKDLVDSYLSLMYHASPLALVAPIYKNDTVKPASGSATTPTASAAPTPTNASAQSSSSAAAAAAAGPVGANNVYLTEYSGHVALKSPLLDLKSSSQLATAFKLYSTRSLYALTESITQPALTLVLVQALNSFYYSYCHIINDDLSMATLYNDALLLNSDVLTQHVRPIAAVKDTGPGAQSANSYRNQVGAILSNLSPSTTLRSFDTCQHYIGNLTSNLVEVVQHISPVVDFGPNHVLQQVMHRSNASSRVPGGGLGGSRGGLPAPATISILELKVALAAVMSSFSALSIHMYNNVNIHITRVLNRILYSHFAVGFEALNRQTLLFNQHLYASTPVLTPPPDLSAAAGAATTDGSGKTPMSLTPAAATAPAVGTALAPTTTLSVPFQTPLLIHQPIYVPWKTTPQTISTAIQYVIAYLDHLHWFIHVVILSLDPPKPRQNTLSQVVLKYNTYATYPTCSCQQHDTVAGSGGASGSGAMGSGDGTDNLVSSPHQHQLDRDPYGLDSGAGGGVDLFSQIDKIKLNFLSPSSVSTYHAAPMTGIDCCAIFTNAIVNTMTTIQSIVMKQRLDKWDCQQVQLDFYALQLALISLAHKQDKATQQIKQHLAVVLPMVVGRFCPNFHNTATAIQNGIKAQVAALVDPANRSNPSFSPQQRVMAQYFAAFPSHVFEPCSADLCAIELPTTSKTPPPEEHNEVDDGHHTSFNNGRPGFNFRQQLKMKVLLTEGQLDRAMASIFYPSFNIHSLPYIGDE